MAGRVKDRGKVFRDPVHGLIRIGPEDAFILELIDTPVFQRLRRIRQLGVSWLTYHGAEHSRFSHSLGVFNFAQRILYALLERYKKEKDVVKYLEQHSKELKAAALLHDIGHTPFSHLLERAFDDSPKHEKTTKNLIIDPKGKIHRILSQADIDPGQVAEITQGPKGTSNDRLIVDIVSSQLDADRMDYLLRDSLQTGVEYGTYDAEWIIRNLCIARDPHSPGVNSDAVGYAHHRLCLDMDRGLHAAEQLILARFYMTLQVYMHRVTRGFEVLLLNLFRHAARLARESCLPGRTPEVVCEYFKESGSLTPDDWMQFDEMAMFAAIAVWADDVEADANLCRMSTAFLHRDRLYKDRVINLRRPGDLMALQMDLGDVGTKGLVWEIDDGEITIYKGLRHEANRQSKDDEAQSAELILLSSGRVGDKAKAIDTESVILGDLDLERQGSSRIYYDKEHASRIESVLNKYGIE